MAGSRSPNHTISALFFSSIASLFFGLCCLRYWTCGDPWRLRLAHPYTYHMAAVVFLGPRIHSDWTNVGSITNLWRSSRWNMLPLQAWILWLPWKMNVGMRLADSCHPNHMNRNFRRDFSPKKTRLSFSKDRKMDTGQTKRSQCALLVS